MTTEANVDYHTLYDLSHKIDTFGIKRYTMSKKYHGSKAIEVKKSTLPKE